MTTTPVRSRRRSVFGFTLTELMVATTIGGLAVAALAGSFLFLTRSTLGLGNYNLLNSRGRTALEILGRDLRMADQVRTMEKDHMIVEVPYSSGRMVVEYVYDEGSRTLLRIDDDGKRAILQDVQSLEFRYYNLRGGSAINKLEAKRVLVDAQLQRSVQRASQSMRIISASFTMRNRRVAA